MAVSAEAQEVLKHYRETGYPRRVYDSPLALEAYCTTRMEEEAEPYRLLDYVDDYVSVTPSITPATHMAYYVLRPKGGLESPLCLLYIHGGSGIFEIGTGQWNLAIRLTLDLGCTTYVPIYPMAPRYTYRNTYAGLQEMYRILRDKHQSSKFFMVGDSTGALLCEALSCYATQQDMPQAAGAIYFTPQLDLRLDSDNPEVKALAEKDPVLSLGANIVDKWAPYASLNEFPPNPACGPLQNHPPCMIVSTDMDLSYPTTRVFIQKMEEQGTPCAHYQFPDLFHNFVQWSIPETDEVLTRTKEWISQTLEDNKVAALQAAEEAAAAEKSRRGLGKLKSKLSVDRTAPLPCANNGEDAKSADSEAKSRLDFSKLKNKLFG